MTNLIKDCISNSELAPIVGGMATAAAGAYDLAEGNFGSGTVKTVLGLTASNVGTFGSSDAVRNQAIKATAMAGMATVAFQGLRNFCTGIYEQSLEQVGKGAAQFTTGAIGGLFLGSLPARTVSIFSQTLSVAAFSGYIAYRGAQDIADGEYLKGVAKVAAGVSGIALSGLVAYQEFSQPSPEIYDTPPPKKSQQSTPPDRSYTRPKTTKPKSQGKKEIRLASVYDNNGNSKREAVSNAATANHRKYAQHWGLDHDVVDKSLVKGQCKNPFTEKAVDCSPYWNKIKYFKNWCKEPQKPGKEEWAIYADDDAVYTNFNINPAEAIDKLRASEIVGLQEPEIRDTSFIIATEGSGTRYNPGAVNTGVMIVRKDPRGCDVIEKIWNNRNVVISTDGKQCPTYGICSDQETPTQGATDKVFYRDAPQLIGKDVTRILARDSTHANRGTIAFNTLNRSGCVRALGKDGVLGDPFDIGDHDRKVNPDGIWQKGDWIGQTAGYPLYGKDLSHLPQGQCKDDPSIPVEAIRLKRVNQMIASIGTATNHEPQNPTFSKITPVFPSEYLQEPTEIPSRPLTRHITIGSAYDNNHDEHRQAISDYVNLNHAEYAKKWGITHEVVEGNLVANQCTIPKTKEPINCAPYWNKIFMLNKWVSEPKIQGFDEEWRIYMDDDMLVTNMQIDPSKAINQLRAGKDTSFIVAEDVIDWQKWYFDNPKPHAGVNTGALILRKDETSRLLLKGILDLRHSPVTKPTPGCYTIGDCVFQSATLHEQEALSMLIRETKSEVNNMLTVVPARDATSTSRGNIAMNTFYRHGCFTRNKAGWKNEAFTYEDGDQAENPQGAFKKGDWLSQVAGVPVWGKELPLTRGNCLDRDDVAEGPVRFNKLKELAKNIIR